MLDICFQKWTLNNLQLMLFFRLLCILKNACYFIKNPRREYRRWADFFVTKELITKVTPLIYSNNQKTLLIVAMGSKIYDSKIFGMLCLPLITNGWNAVALLDNPRRQNWIVRYLKIHGIKKFIYWSEINSDKPEKETLENFHSNASSFNKIKEWSFDHCWIGPQILSSISRSTMEGNFDIKSNEFKIQLKGHLSDTIKRISIAKKLLKQVSPDLILLNEANYAKYAPLTDLAVSSNIDLVQIIQTSRDDALVLRRLNKETRREHPASVSRKTFDKFKNTPLTESESAVLKSSILDRYTGKWFIQGRNQPGVIRFSKKEIVDQLKLNSELKVVVVFSHVLWDANLFYGKDLFDDYSHWFQETIKAACNNNKINWVIKMHPANLWKRKREGVNKDYAEDTIIKNSVESLPNHVKLLFPDSEISTLSLLETIDYAVTVRGTICTEAPCFGVRTLTAGTGRCDSFGFTTDSSTKSQFLERLSTIETLPPMTENEIALASRHAHLAFCKRPWIFKSWKANFYNDTPDKFFESNLLPVANTWNEVLNNKDLSSWQRWIETGTSVDFLSDD